MDIFRLITPATYWVLIVMWTIILVFYVSRIRLRRLQSRLIYTLIIILAIDAFRTLFESLYFGAWNTALAGFIPKEIHTFLIRPEMVIIPKLLNVISAVVIIAILLRRWLPQEEFEISQMELIIKERTSELVTVNENLKQEITERKQVEKALLESEKFFSGTLNDMLTFVAVLEPDGKVIFVNNTPLNVAGITLNDVKGKMFYDAFWWQYSEETRQQIKEDIEICATGETLVHEIELQIVEGGLMWIEYSMHPIYDEDGEIKYLVPEGRDITEHKQAEKHIQHLQSVLKAIRDVNQLIVHEKNKEKLLQEACEILNQTRNYKLVWIGLVEDGTKNVLPAAQAGFEKGYLKSIKITWDDSANGQGPTGTTIKSKTPFVMHDIAGDPRYKPWRDEAMKRGYSSSTAVPLIHENRVFGTLNVYAALSDAFGEEEIGLLVEVSQDIAFALHSIELNEKREQAEEELQKHKDENTRLAVIAKERGELQDWINTFDTFVGKFDPDGKGVIFNDAPIKAGGLTRDDVVGKYFPDTKWCSHSKTERARIIECFEKAKAGKASRIETSFRSEDGTPVPIIFNCQPVMGDDGKVKYITAEGKIIIDEISLRNSLKAEKENLEIRVKERTTELETLNKKLRTEITVRKQAEEDLQKYQQQLEKRVEDRTAELQAANKELKSFAYSVSHDLRAPLRAISGFAQIISQRYRASLKEEGRHYFDNIVEASTYMGKLIEDLLKYSQIGRKAVDLVPTPLGGILEMITDTLSERIAESNAQLELPADLPAVMGDRTLLIQIFTNLLDNALLYHKPEKPPQIKVTNRLDDGHMIISVSDKGIGIAPEYQDKIFDIFQRLHDQDEYPGTGIGLAIVKKSVELQKGVLWVESSPGKGSTFNVKLPLGNEV